MAHRKTGKPSPRRKQNQEPRLAGKRRMPQLPATTPAAGANNITGSGAMVDPPEVIAASGELSVHISADEYLEWMEGVQRRAGLIAACKNANGRWKSEVRRIMDVLGGTKPMKWEQVGKDAHAMAYDIVRRTGSRLVKLGWVKEVADGFVLTTSGQEAKAEIFAEPSE